ncbi:primase-helicase family protein [Vibrio harveyi]|uniref:primase-helicase family protein n=1 Tax=Vibrio harveyi TaxID=669 RepID=UPI0038CD93C5
MVVKRLAIPKKDHAELDALVSGGMGVQEAIIKIVTNRFIRIGATGQTYDTLKDELSNGTKVIRSLFNTTTAPQKYGDECDVYAAIEDAINKMSEVVSVDTRPDKGQFFYNKLGELMVNRYQAKEVEKLEPPMPVMQMLDDYFDFLAGGRDEVKQYIINWCAQLVFKPEQRNKVALLLYGRSQGTGKGTLQSMLIKLLGIQGVSKPNDSKEAMLSRFKGQLENKRLLILDELYHDGFAVSEKAKPLITEDYLDAEKKGVDARSIRIYFAMLATSNKMQPLWLEANDRRWTCVNVEFARPRKPRTHPDNQLQAAMVDSFRTWLEGDEKAENYCAWYLDNRSNLEGFDTNLSLVTPEYDELVANSVDLAVTDFEETIQEVINSGVLYVHASTLFEEDSRLKKHKISRHRRKDLLLAHGFEPFPEVRIGSKTKKGFYVAPIVKERELSDEAVKKQIKEREGNTTF